MKILLSFSFFFISFLLSAQIPSGKFCHNNIDTWILSSKEVGRDFKIYVKLPAAYDSTRKNYPVLYMTDGDWNMTVAENCFSMLRQDYLITEPVIIGIGYGDQPNQRAIDMNQKKGADAFMRFIQNELFVFAERYSDNKERAIYGHSMGGHFATYVLFHYPGVFQKILIGAPPSQLGNLTRDAKEYFSKNDSLACEVFAGVGSYEESVVKDIQEFETYLKSINYKGIRAGFRITPNAGHGAAISQVMEDAIAFAYCNKHVPVTLSSNELSKYAGSYFNDANKGYVIKIVLEKGKLFFHDPLYGVNEIIPFKQNGFFMRINETFEIVFENGKMYSVSGDSKWGFTKMK